MADSQLLGAVEAGGTKFICLVGTSPDDIRTQARIETTTPDDTIEQVLDFFRSVDEPTRAIGIGSFGPVDLHPNSDTWGFITTTPKPGWQQTDFAARLQRELGVAVAFDTDVNAAALGESRWGAAAGDDDCLYLTVGTGVGGGAVVAGEPLHGLLHPEMGHVRVPRAPGDDFAGTCPFHNDCLEGMVSGPAIEARTGRPAEQLGPEDPAWQYVAHYLAHALVDFILILSPHRLILGGGVMHQQHLFPMVRRRVLDLLNDYLQTDAVRSAIDQYIVPPGLGDRAGVLGALALASRAAALDKS